MTVKSEQILGLIDDLYSDHCHSDGLMFQNLRDRVKTVLFQRGQAVISDREAVLAEIDSFIAFHAGRGESTISAWKIRELVVKMPDTIRRVPGDYSIGSTNWNGLSKLIEEAGEVIQVAGKILGAGGQPDHWDGSNLPSRLTEELGDLLASIQFVSEMSSELDYLAVLDRRDEKLQLFRLWDYKQRADL